MDKELETKINEIREWLGTGSINIFGPQFAGKDTHGNELSRFLDAPVIGGGDLIRNSDQQDVKDIIDKGNLAPQDKYLALVLPYLKRDMFDGHPLIFSSVGRWDGEQQAVMQGAQESGHPIKAVLLLNISIEEAHRRWEIAERGREDDASHEYLETRLREFQDKTLPVIEYYRNLGLLIEIDGMPPQPVVTRDIIEKLHAFAKNN